MRRRFDNDRSISANSPWLRIAGPVEALLRPLNRIWHVRADQTGADIRDWAVLPISAIRRCRNPCGHSVMAFRGILVRQQSLCVQDGSAPAALRHPQRWQQAPDGPREPPGTDEGSRL